MSEARRLRSQQGFTLVELMVSLTALSIAIAAAFTLAFSLSRGFTDHRLAVGTESSTRIVLDMMASGIRASSPGMSTGEIWDVCQGGPTDTIEVTNSTTGPDEIRLVHGLGGAFASLTSTHDIFTGTVAVDDNTMFESELWTPGIIIEPSSGDAHLVEMFASSADPTVMEVRAPGECTIVAAGDQSYEAGSFLVRAVHVVYSVDPPFLMIDPDGPGVLEEEVMAEGIEDLQIAVGIENGTDPDSLTETAIKTDDEWHFNAPGDATAGLVSAGGWRALRITVVGIVNRETRQNGTYFRPEVEDRDGAVVSDPYRRRAFSTTVELRNLSQN